MRRLETCPNGQVWPRRTAGIRDALAAPVVTGAWLVQPDRIDARGRAAPASRGFPDRWPRAARSDDRVLPCFVRKVCAELVIRWVRFPRRAATLNCAKNSPR